MTIIMLFQSIGGEQYTYIHVDQQVVEHKTAFVEIASLTMDEGERGLSKRERKK